MAKSQTDKSRLPSQYANGFITKSQYLSETLCTLIARGEGKRLPYKFWELDDWRKIFRRHIVEANRLLKTYSFEAILETLKDPYIQRSKCRSFRFPPFMKILQKNQRLRKSLSQKYFPPAETSQPITSDASARQVVSPIDQLKSL